MQWFKHDTNSTMDFKIKKLIIKYGAIGYAIYFHCLELIASEISDNNITFELEHDSEIIADDLRIKGSEQQSGKELVEEIMRYMITLNLFEESEGHIFCFKLLKRLDTSMTSSTKLRALITKAKNQEQFIGLQEDKNSDKKQENHDGVMTKSGFNMQEKTRKENITKEKKTQENTNYCFEQTKQNFETLPEPRNDLEKIERTYFELWDSLYQKGLVSTPKPIIDYGKIRKIEKGLLEDKDNPIPVESIQKAISNSVNHNLCIQNGYSLQTILSKNILNQLINGSSKNNQQQKSVNIKKDLNDQDGWL